VLVAAALLSEGADALMNPFVAVDLVASGLGWCTADDIVDPMLVSSYVEYEFLMEGGKPPATYLDLVCS